MTKIKVAVFGASGRMGQEIAALMAQSDRFSPALGISRKGQAENFLKSVKKLDRKDFKNIDVIVDFSVAASFPEILKFATENKIPIVSGTTGLSGNSQKMIQQSGKAIPVLWSPNMSLGIAALEKALDALVVLSHFDFQIEETHHKGKKDRPSGTALLLQRRLEKVLKRKLPEPLAIRGGGVFGVHQIQVLGDSETLTFEHRALNRRIFAEGALVAAQWLIKKKKGLYCLQDVLKP